MEAQGKPFPIPTRETETFWEGCAKGKLLFQRCKACNRAQFYPRTFCANCGADELEWCESAGIGTIYAVTAVYRAPTPAFKRGVPYAIALVELSEGFRLMANIIGAKVDDAKIGDRVTLCFERRGDVPVPQFRRQAP